MKTIQREVKTYESIYVSVDGKEFKNEADCKAWENSYKGTLAASWNLIKKEDANSCRLGLMYSSDDHECYVLKPKDIEEITLINAYLASSTGDTMPRLTTEHIGKLVAFNFGYDHDYCDIYILEDHIKQISQYISTLEEKIDVNEEK